MDKLTWAKANSTWLGRFQIIDAMEGCIVKLSNGDQASVRDGKIHLPDYGPVKLLNYTNGELVDLLKRSYEATNNLNA